MFDPVKLNNLFNIPGSNKVSKRVGRGIGSGKGKTCGVGTKGQRARCGVAIKGFEGGQMPLIKRLPKRGFNPLKRTNYTVVNIQLINYLLEAKLLKASQLVNKELLVEFRIIKNTNVLVKLLGKESLNAKVSFDLDDFSLSVVEKIKEAGGEAKKKGVAL